MSTWEAPGHDTWEDASGAYVLGALPADEAAAFESHLAGCPACRVEVEELGEAVEVLPACVAPLDPPPALRERLLVDVRREADLLAAAGPEADRPPAPRRLRAPRWLPAAAAAAALGAGIVIGLLVGSGGPESRTVTLTDSGRAAGAHVRLVVRDGEATLAADHLSPPPGDRVYQVWIKPQGGSVQPTAALFVPRADGSALVALPPEAAESEALMVSAEPRGGSAAPTSPPVLAGKPTS
jgi:anti-sigma-K factor RskA